MTSRIPILDGWRGLAILLVLVEHLQNSYSGSAFAVWSSTGQHGVSIFFVLSGFLITRGLVDETPTLGAFYVRRFFRLMPAAWTYLAAISIISVVAHTPLTSVGEIASCVFFFRNYVHETHPTVAIHFWSLSIEEQFYLVWPSVLLVLGRTRAKWAAVIATLATVAWTQAHWNFYANGIGCNFYTEARANAILVGCILALMMAEPAVRSKLERFAYLAILPSVAVLLYCMARFDHLPPFPESVAIGLLIVASVSTPDKAIFAWLKAPLLMEMGQLAYSLYLWNQLFTLHMHNVVATVLGACLTLFCAIASYRLIERPCIRIGHRLTDPARKSVGQPA